MKAALFARSFFLACLCISQPSGNRIHSTSDFRPAKCRPTSCIDPIVCFNCLGTKIHWFSRLCWNVDAMPGNDGTVVVWMKTFPNQNGCTLAVSRREWRLKIAQTPKWEWLPLQVEEEWKPNPPCGEGHRYTQESVLGFISMVFYPSCVRVDCRNMPIRRNCRRDSRCLAEAWVDMAGRGIRAETSSIESDAEVQSGLILASLRWWLMMSIWMLHPHWKWDCASNEALWPKVIWERSFGASFEKFLP